MLFNSIVHVQADVGDFEGAVATAKLIPYESGREVRDFTFRYIANKQAQAGRLSELQSLIKSLSDIRDRTAALLGVTEGFSSLKIME